MKMRQSLTALVAALFVSTGSAVAGGEPTGARAALYDRTERVSYQPVSYTPAARGVRNYTCAGHSRASASTLGLYIDHTKPTQIFDVTSLEQAVRLSDRFALTVCDRPSGARGDRVLISKGGVYRAM